MTALIALGLSAVFALMVYCAVYVLFGGMVLLALLAALAVAAFAVAYGLGGAL